jgi:hypothetical protein
MQMMGFLYVLNCMVSNDVLMSDDVMQVQKVICDDVMQVQKMISNDIIKVQDSLK